MPSSSDHGPAEGRFSPVTYLRALQANAEALLSDAELLFSHQRWARALALAVLALEEEGEAVLATSGLFPDDDLAELSARRHEDKLMTASLVGVGFLGDLADLRIDICQLDSRALHVEKLSALYVDQTGDGLGTPGSVTKERAEQVIADAKRVVQWLGRWYNGLAPEVLECAQRLNAELAPTLDRYVLDHGEEAGLDMARRMIAWSDKLNQGEVHVDGEGVTRAAALESEASHQNAASSQAGAFAPPGEARSTRVARRGGRG